MAVLFWGFTFFVATLLPIGEMIFGHNVPLKYAMSFWFMVQFSLWKILITYCAAAFVVWFFLRLTNFKNRLLPDHPGRNLLICGIVFKLVLGPLVWVLLYAHIYKILPAASILLLIPSALLLMGSAKVFLHLQQPSSLKNIDATSRP